MLPDLDVNSVTNDIISQTQQYLEIPSVVAHEKPFLDFLEQQYSAIGLVCFNDDNVLVVSGNRPDQAYLSAHIDRHGIMSIGGGDYRYAAHAIKNYKYRDFSTNEETIEKLENICSQYIHEDVYAYGRWSGEVIAKGHIEHCHFCSERSNLIFKINDMPDLPEGVPVSYAPHALEKDSYVTGQLDNVLSAGLIYALFKNGYQGTAVFTAEEEIGKSWLHLSNYLKNQKIETKNLIILDTSPYTVSDYADEGRVVLRNKDSFGLFNMELVQNLQKSCNDLSIPYDMKDETLIAQGKAQNDIGRTELGRLVHESGGMWNGATVQTPTFNYHTNKESTTRKAIGNVFLFLHNYLLNMN